MGTVLPDWVVALPEWMLVGLAVGGVLAALVAVVFVVGARLFPDADPRRTQTTDGGENRRRSEIREYLRTIDEPFVEDRVVAGQLVAFYLPERDVAITFDARAYFRLDREDTAAVLAEYEMPGDQIGRRLPFETPELESQPDRDPDPDAAFDILGLPPSATSEEIKNAYRDRIKEVHPDHGGDKEAFQRVREAYMMARRRIK